ncbi:egg cell-secreted protein 1.2-like [Papaver somniferum]|uniref:egg cell-secreted protein 1.2-like n=1 Tax=Papaver somniferum TaxID=3469 RepID=UPI000E6FB978|nr:egg cell-secreted protein 1.2-like [Papaver somniferum]
MALINGRLFLVLVISALMANATTVIGVRDLETTVRYSVGLNLAARINGEDEGVGMAECLNALYELRSCTNEIILFFMDGEMYLGIECCRAICIITRECRPSMLNSIGFTAEEGDILHGYCDASHSTTPRSSPVTMLPPVQTPAQTLFMGPSIPL